MKKTRSLFLGGIVLGLMCLSSMAQTPEIPADTPTVAVEEVSPPDITPSPATGAANEYKVGVDDILSINVLQPDQIQSDVTVSPDGSISFPYIGNIMIKGLTLNQIQKEIQDQLASGYLKYPLVVVTLKESRSRKFFVYGEVIKPGSYFLEDNTTVLRAISMGGGFTRFGSASRVKVLRPKESQAGYEMVQVNIKSVMEGDSQADLVLKAGDIVVVSEGIF